MKQETESIRVTGGNVLKAAVIVRGGVTHGLEINFVEAAKKLLFVLSAYQNDIAKVMKKQIILRKPEATEAEINAALRAEIGDVIDITPIGYHIVESHTVCVHHDEDPSMSIASVIRDVSLLYPVWSVLGQSRAELNQTIYNYFLLAQSTPVPSNEPIYAIGTRRILDEVDIEEMNSRNLLRKRRLISLVIGVGPLIYIIIYFSILR